MARLFTVTAFVFALIAVAAAQFDFFGSLRQSGGSGRDPRDNRGPVTFPITSPGSETSGVVVGASGYGFVPPGQRGGIGPHGAGPNSFFNIFRGW